jgi:ABC-type Na+ efflux pump permease subunit
MSTISSTRPTVGAGIDPRGPRVAATLTSIVLAAVLVTPTTVAVVLLALQAAVFAVGSARGVQHTPYSWLFRTFVRPRLGAPHELEDPRPPQFAQTVGLVFAVIGLIGFLTGVAVVGLVATGFALAAALLNAVFGYCLGCEIYLLYRRASAR